MKNLSHFFVKFFFPGGKKTFLREIFDLEFTIQSFFFFFFYLLRLNVMNPIEDGDAFSEIASTDLTLSLLF